MVPGLPPNMFFLEPLAERLAGRDLSMPPGSADIQATFNGDLHGCDPSLDWYYGLDGQSGSKIDLAAVVLHELAHGLGFSSMIDLSTGAFPSGLIDVFSAHIYDNGVGMSWSQMSNAQRLTSAQNVRHLVWNGDNVTRAAAKVLATGPPLLVTQPTVAGLTANLGETNFGPLVSMMGAMGPLAVGSPVDGCSTLASHAGSIFLLQGGGGCSPLAQASNAEKAGAKAVLVTDANDFSPPSSVELPPNQLAQLTVHIPVVGITLEDGQLLANQTSVTVTLSGQTGRLVGADEMGRPYLYASVPIREGSSVSHWDTLARPHLLEEPESGYGGGHDITMELALMRDIGWTVTCGNGQADPGEQCDNGDANSDTTPNACRTTCRRAACGDGTVDTGEQCDLGARNGSASACRTDCTLPPDGSTVERDSGLGTLCEANCTGNPPKGGCSCSAAAAPGSWAALAMVAAAALGATRSRRRARAPR
jgi:MYXO-CTERM domain-containing protein